eukprot:scaffold5222_cov282-Chaetoceros_neogracile.AAC.15
MSTTASPTKYNIAIIGGGITGATAAQSLAQHPNVNVHLFDQGRRGVGGRTSSRTSTDASMRWDHGCQFFRADTDQFKELVQHWMAKDLIQKWEGRFISSPHNKKIHRDFFGLPSLPPFYVGKDGMQSISQGILEDIITARASDDKDHIHNLNLFTGTRVAHLERDEESKRWKIFGTTGNAAFHDTPEKVVQQSNGNDKIKTPLGCAEGYDAIILTDVSSSFGNWHRASAGVPESFAARVRERVGSRVPLFTAMIAFDKESGIPFDAGTFDNSVLWFASKSNSKPGMDTEGMKECWTLVSTPEYAMEQISETPMQDPKTGDFIPQSEDYLTTVPGPDLIKAFCKDLTSNKGILGEGALSDNDIPNIIQVDAQRWGSAMPCHRHLDDTSKTRKVLSGVPYDSGRSPLAPTKLEACSHGDDKSFLMDEELMILQAGDMMSTYTPGFESAALSGLDAATCLWRKLSN